MEIKVRFYDFGIFHVYSSWRLIVENTPSFQPNPDPQAENSCPLCAERQEQDLCVQSWRRQGEVKTRSGHPAKNKKAAFTGNSPLKTTSTTALSCYPNPSAILLKITTK